MQTSVSNLRIKDETSAKLELETSNRRWLFLFFVLFFMVLPTLLLVMTIQDGRDQMVGIVAFSIALLMCSAFLLMVAFRSRLVVHSDLRTISLERSYWISIGAFGREREKSWSFLDIHDISISSAGMAKSLIIKTNNKNDLALGFSLKAKKDGERLYDLLKSWVEGTPIEHPDFNETLDETVQIGQSEKVLKNVERLLYFFGVIGLVSSGMDLLTAWAVEKNQFDMNIDFLSTGLISFVVGLVYVGCGIGIRKRAEGALWVAMFVVFAERLNSVVQGMANGLEFNSSLLISLFITLFLLNYLWSGIKAIRTMNEQSLIDM